MDRPRAGAHYPRSVGEFEVWFGTDADCLDYLEWLRWPTGFGYPECGHVEGGGGGWATVASSVPGVPGGARR